MKVPKAPFSEKAQVPFSRVLPFLLPKMEVPDRLSMIDLNCLSAYLRVAYQCQTGIDLNNY